jgi:hypothetical protein
MTRLYQLFLVLRLRLKGLKSEDMKKFDYFNSLYYSCIEDDKKFYGRSNLNQLEAVYQNGVRLLFCDVESGVKIKDLIKLFSKANYCDTKLAKCTDTYLFNFWTKAIYHNAMSDYVPGVIYVGHYNKLSKHIIQVLKQILLKNSRINITTEFN